MAKAQIRVSVDPELWSSLKYEGEKDTQLQDRIMAVISRLVKIDRDPMAALGKLESLSQVNEPVTQLLDESVGILNKATEKLDKSVEAVNRATEGLDGAIESIETCSLPTKEPQSISTEAIEENLGDADF